MTSASRSSAEGNRAAGAISSCWRAMGCGLGQGYLIARADGLPAAIEALIGKRLAPGVSSARTPGNESRG